MPRIARLISESGIYHIIMRGTNRRDIFHDNEDWLRFLETINRYKRMSSSKVHGWCLMNNHLHLLMGEGNEPISVTMKRIGVSFVQFYHLKYNTTGHLFQDRFKSEAVNDDNYLIAAIRYIHQNPVKAGIVRKPLDWAWSSCRGYYGYKINPPELLDSELVLNCFTLRNDVKEAIEKFKEFNEAVSEENFLENIEKKRLSDDQARAEINKAFPELDIIMIKNLPKAQRDEIFITIKHIEGLTHRQAARILGVSASKFSRVKI